jgi:hypothetical protein
MQSDYGARLKWLRSNFAKEPRAVWKYGATEYTDVQINRRRFALACLALDVPDEEITAALPGFDPDIKGLHPRWTPKNPPSPEPYVFGADPDEYIEDQVRKYRTYLKNEVQQAHQRFAQLGAERPARHRNRELDLAARYFITVRRKILKHSYSVIELDHVKPLPNSAAESRKAASLLKFTVHEIASAVRLGENLGVAQTATVVPEFSEAPTATTFPAAPEGPCAPLLTELPAAPTAPEAPKNRPL